MIKDLFVCSLCFCAIVVDDKMVEVRVDAEVRLTQSAIQSHLANGYRHHVSKSIWIPTLCAQTISSNKPSA